MGVVVAGTRVLSGGIGVVAVAVSGIRVRVSCTGCGVGVARASVGIRAQAVAVRTNPIAISKDPSLFLLIAKPPFRVVGKFRKGRPLPRKRLCAIMPPSLSPGQCPGQCPEQCPEPVEGSELHLPASSALNWLNRLRTMSKNPPGCCTVIVPAGGR